MRTYPWGDEPATCTLAVMVEAGGACGRGGTLPVGSKPAGVSPYGAEDMAGNLSEWVSDWYEADYYHDSPVEAPGGPASGFGRVNRGGSGYGDGDGLRAAGRRWTSPGDHDLYVGFRCVRSLP